MKTVILLPVFLFGVALGWYLKPCGEAELVQRTIIERDTVKIPLIKACELTFSDSVSIYKEIRKARSKARKTAPVTPKEPEVDTTVHDKVGEEVTIYKQEHSFEMKDSLVTIQGSFDVYSLSDYMLVDSMELEYSLDTVILNKRTRDVVILQSEVDKITETVFVDAKYSEFGIMGSASTLGYYGVGVYARTPIGFSIGVESLFSEGWEGAGVRMNIPIVRKRK